MPCIWNSEGQDNTAGGALSGWLAKTKVDHKMISYKLAQCYWLHTREFRTINN